MIIDIPYIKKSFNIQTNDDKIAYLINHFFDYICEHINIETTLEKEQISLENIENPIDNPTFPNDELTLFQETLIFAIICNLSTLGISNSYIPNEIYEKYITFFDTDANGEYVLTYCEIFKNCLDRLTDKLQSSSNVEYVRQLFNILEENVPDREIEFLLEHYTKYFTELYPKADTESPLFEQAVLLSIACHLYKTNPTSITTPVMYYVDEVREKFELNFDKAGNTWCDLANAAINDLKKQTFGYYGIAAYDRPGARTKYNNYGPTG